MTKTARKWPLAISACAMCAISSSGFASTLTAVNDDYTVTENTLLSVAAPGVLSNDIIPAGLTVAAVEFGPPSHGTLDSFNSDGSFTYTPNAGFLGVDTFTYTDTSDDLIIPLATVTIDVVAPTPLPATLPLFATGLGALGLLGWRRRRKAQA